VIGALAGYPLIKHCMNQGYDVIEFLNGNTDLKPADEPILQEKFAGLPGNRSVDHWLDVFQKNVLIFAGLSTLQLREFMLDSSATPMRRAMSCSAATSRAPRCSPLRKARLRSRSTRMTPASPCRSRKARSSAKWA
jgi:hypothetical protein